MAVILAHMAYAWWKVEKLHELFSHLETFQPCTQAASHLLKEMLCPCMS